MMDYIVGLAVVEKKQHVHDQLGTSVEGQGPDEMQKAHGHVARVIAVISRAGQMVKGPLSFFHGHSAGASVGRSLNS